MNHTDLVSGLWTGFFNYQAGGERHPTDLTLSFARGVIAGQGEDESGLFGVAGCYDEEIGELSWTKTYFGGASVRYKGFQEGGGIWGTWEIAGSSRGGFQIWPSIENVMKAIVVANAQRTQKARPSEHS